MNQSRIGSEDSGRSEPEERVEALRRLLLTGRIGSQDELRRSLTDQGFDVTQSTISRDLRRLGAVRAVNSAGDSVYRLPDEAPMPTRAGSIRDLVLSVASNGAIVVVRTTPGSASLVARHLDQTNPDGVILGTIAGDDTIFVALANTSQGKHGHEAVQDRLFQ